MLGVLMGAVGLLLVIACVNIANLTLARASSRVSARSRCGARSVRRAVSSCASCSSRVSSSRSAAAPRALVALAWSKDWIVAMLPADLPRLPEVRFDGGMIAIGLALSMVAGAAFGIVPAIQVSGVNPGDNLKDAGRGGGAGRRRASLPRRARRGGNRDLARAPRRRRVCWCAASGACCRSTPASIRRASASRRSGFPSRTIRRRIPTARRRSAMPTSTRCCGRVGALPGVESVGMSVSNRTPFSGSGVTQRFTFVGESTAPADVRRAQFQVASPEYFATLKSPILSGRAFTAADTIGTRAGRHRQRHAREDAVARQGSGRPQHLARPRSPSASSASSPTFTTMGSTCRWRRESTFRCSSARTTR